MEIKGESNLVKFGHHENLILVALLKVAEFCDAKAVDFGHELFGLLEILDNKHSVVFFR